MPQQLKLTFHPSFHPSLDFTLKMDKDTGVVSYRLYDPTNPLMNAPFAVGFDALTLAVGGKTYLNFAEIIRSFTFKDYKSRPKEGMIVIDGIKTSTQYISSAVDTGMLELKSPGHTLCLRQRPYRLVWRQTLY
jgi:hypothetical protein